MCKSLEGIQREVYYLNWKTQDDDYNTAWKVEK